MQISVEKKMGVILVRIMGEIDLYNSSELKEELDQRILTGEKRFVVNLGQVSYIDSSGIGALISSRRNLQKIGGELRLSNVHGAVREVLVMTRLMSFFDVHEEDEQAIASFETK